MCGLINDEELMPSKCTSSWFEKKIVDFNGPPTVVLILDTILLAEAGRMFLSTQKMSQY